MSRSNPTELAPNPATKFFDWNGAEGFFYYFDKNKGDKGEKVKVDLPFRFLVLDVLSTIKGFSDADQKGFYSNEVRSTKDEVLNVRMGKTTVELGLYADIKDRLAKLGADYTQSVYACIKDGNEFVIVNINMKGAALSAWIEFRNKAKGAINEKAIIVKSTLEGKKGAVKYQMPVFELIDVSPETNNIAIELDKELQEYLKQYLSNNKHREDERTAEQAVNAAHANTFGGTPAELTEQEKAFLVKPEIDNSQPAQEMGELPSGFFEDDGNPDDLPF
jgi:hypothetical protein